MLTELVSDLRWERRVGENITTSFNIRVRVRHYSAIFYIQRIYSNWYCRGQKLGCFIRKFSLLFEVYDQVILILFVYYAMCNVLVVFLLFLQWEYKGYLNSCFTYTSDAKRISQVCLRLYQFESKDIAVWSGRFVLSFTCEYCSSSRRQHQFSFFGSNCFRVWNIPRDVI